MSARLEWCCSECGDPIDDDAGYVAVDTAEAIRVEQAHEEFDRQRRESGAMFIDMAALLALPKAARWFAAHRRCDLNPGRASDYWFGVERCRTIGELLDWNSHLAEKRWVAHTDWARFIAKHCRGASR